MVIRELDSIKEDQDESLKVCQIISAFRDNFHSEPAYVIRAPGRINLIGDHIDYHGFSVLPMAIENSIRLACSFPATSLQCQQREHNHHDEQQPRTTPNKLLVNNTNSSIPEPDEIMSNQQTNNIVSLKNNNSSLYANFEGRHSFSYGAQLDKSHQWHHYVLCGYHGVMANKLLNVQASQVFKHAKDIFSRQHQTHASSDLPNHHDSSSDPQAIDIEEDRLLKDELASDFNIFVDSDLPPASGLSSSSALVCASALATELFLEDNKHAKRSLVAQGTTSGVAEGLKSYYLTDSKCDSTMSINSNSMAENCAKFEHLIGTHGGGMDQAVIITAQDGYAKHVQFMPTFTCTNVRLPSNVVWLVSHCGSNYPKAATSGFNSRVLETKLAAALILKRLHANCDKFSLDHALTLGQVKFELFNQMSANEIATVLREKVFTNNEHELSIDEICCRLDMSRAELVANFKTSEEFLIKSELDKRVCLLKRCEHVFEEAERVEQFKSICETAGDKSMHFRDVERLGQLMSDSHVSLRDKYECSHPDLDKLVDISLNAGSLGARLTGAGWGGCIVSLVEEDKCDKVLGQLKKVSKFTFQTEPKSGCTVIRV